MSIVDRQRRPDRDREMSDANISTTERAIGPDPLAPDARDRVRAMAEFTARGKAFRFPKGQSGNPMGGRGSVTRAANSPREASPEMMAGLIDLAKNAVDERVRSVCLIAVLDRAGVRPIDYDPAEDAAARQPKFDPSLATQRRRQRTSAPKTTSAQSNDVGIYRHRSMCGNNCESSTQTC